MNDSIVKPSNSKHQLLSSPVPLTDGHTAVKNKMSVLSLNNLICRDDEDVVWPLVDLVAGIPDFSNARVKGDQGSIGMGRGMYAQSI
jgi:hypothetical protein